MWIHVDRTDFTLDEVSVSLMNFAESSVHAAQQIRFHVETA